MFDEYLHSIHSVISMNAKEGRRVIQGFRYMVCSSREQYLHNFVLSFSGNDRKGAKTCMFFQVDLKRTFKMSAAWSISY